MGVNKIQLIRHISYIHTTFFPIKLYASKILVSKGLSLSKKLFTIKVSEYSPKYKFKVSLHQLFVCILELEDTYVDTPTLVNNLSKMNVK